MFVAVDNSSGPSAGDVYVADFAEHGSGNRVSKFAASGQLVSGWGEGGEVAGGGAESPFGAMAGVAVDPSGIFGSGAKRARLSLARKGL